MSPRAPLLVSAILALFWLSASCGGSTSSERTGSGRSGDGGEAGNSGSAGAAGSGPRLPARCMLPAESGPCLAYAPSYFHNAATGLCEPFIYGGCGGNDNRFPSLAECQTACHGWSPDMDLCQSPADCMLAAAGCCGGCADSAAWVFVAINKRAQAQHQKVRGCAGLTCGGCPDVDELASTIQYFVSTCDQGQCTVVDIRQNAITACATDSECVLRDGSGCCPDCDSRLLIAINSSADQGLLCPIRQPCPATCTIDAQYAAACQSGRCTVTRR